MTLQLLEHEQHKILERIRSWLTLDLRPQHSHPISGGESGATLSRLSVKWQEQMAPSADNLPNMATTVGSAVIKVDTMSTLHRTQQAYQSIHPDYQHYVARVISGPHSLEEEEQGYLLLEDLAAYKTLHTILCDGDHRFLCALYDQFVAFLQRFYTMPTVKEPLGESGIQLVDRLYFAPIQRSLAKLQRYRSYLIGFHDHVQAIQTHCAALRAHLATEAAPPRTVMHGDLHLRNVMLTEIRSELGDIDFRLIDLDRFDRHSGDSAYDLGELLTDIDIRTADGELPIDALGLHQRLRDAFCQAASHSADSSFQQRLALAQARSLLKLTELQVENLVTKLALPAGLAPDQMPPVLIQTHLANAVTYLVHGSKR